MRFILNPQCQWATSLLCFPFPGHPTGMFLTYNFLGDRSHPDISTDGNIPSCTIGL